MKKVIEELLYTVSSRSSLNLLIKAILEFEHVLKNLNC